MGKTHLEVAIHEEARALVEDIKSLGEKPSEYPRGLRTAVLNVVWQLVASKRYDLNSKEVDGIFNVVESFREEASSAMFAGELFPLLKALPDILKRPLFKLHILEGFRSEMKRICNVSLELNSYQC